MKSKTHEFEPYYHIYLKSAYKYGDQLRVENNFFDKSMAEGSKPCFRQVGQRTDFWF